MGINYSSNIDPFDILSKREYLAAGVLAIISSLGFLQRFWKHQEDLICYKNRAIFITGCDSGLGYSLAHYCHKLGMVVIAACHTNSSTKGAQDLEQLGDSQRMFVIREFDVRNKESIVLARKVVEKVLAETGADLWAVVNNAAMLVLAKLEWLIDSMVESQIEVNLVGPIHVCRVFLPLLYKTKGSRIINITSPCADTHLPMAGVYGATKAGLEAVSDSLRVEATHNGVKVVLIDPGDILGFTPLASRQGYHYKEMKADLDKSINKKELETFNKFSDVFSNHLPRPPLGIIQEKEIYRVFQAALFSRNPYRRYSASPWHVRLYEWFMIWSPTTWGDGEKKKLLQM